MQEPWADPHKGTYIVSRWWASRLPETRKTGGGEIERALAASPAVLHGERRGRKEGGRESVRERLPAWTSLMRPGAKLFQVCNHLGILWHLQVEHSTHDFMASPVPLGPE